MLEREQTQPSIWERLTPDNALELAEKILRGIENGKLKKEIYEPIVDKLINFALGEGNNSSSESEVDQTNTVEISQEQSPKEKKKRLKNTNKTPFSLGVTQLPPEERALYERRRKTSRSICKANKDGRPKVKNRGRKY